MNSTTKTSQITIALSALALIQLLMFLAMLTRTEPHPPLVLTPFAMAPFLSASIVICLSAAIYSYYFARPNQLLTITAIVLALVSYGPQKYIDPAFPQIWPAVLTAQGFILLAVYQWISETRQRLPKS